MSDQKQQHEDMVLDSQEDLKNMDLASPDDGQEYVKPADGEFTLVMGRLPFKAPNIRLGHEVEDISKIINTTNNSPTPSGLRYCLMSACCATGIGCCYLWNKMVLVEEGELGITINNGVYEVLPPGRHILASPLHEYQATHSLSKSLIQCGPITIVRIPEGQIGFAYHNSHPIILLPGLHCRKDAQFVYHSSQSALDDLIQFGPIKIVTVRSGYVRVCFINGKVRILPEGRFAINSPTFQVIARPLSVTQENLEFKAHKAMLDGGINMLVQAQLTYRVENLEKLIKQIGTRLDDSSNEDSVEKVIERITAAEISRVFSSIHLEQIASATDNRRNNQDSFLGEQKSLPGELEGEMRSKICQSILGAIRPLIEPWGVKCINFQIQSCVFADAAFAKEYEAASLAISKAKAQLRSTSAENEIKITKSRAAAESARIEAEGAKEATVCRAKGEAESKTILAAAEAKVQLTLAEADAQARKVEASARNEAAEMMQNEFARQFALAGQQVQFASVLKATTLTVLPDSVIGKPIVSNLLATGKK